MAVRTEETIPATLVRLTMVLLLAMALPARAGDYPADAPLVSDTVEPPPLSRTDACRIAPEEPEKKPTEGGLWLTLGEVTVVNAAVWSVDWFIRKAEWADISPKVWGRNLASGFEWDTNKFTPNQLDHPYNGGIYYNLAHDNGFNYWESYAFTIFGSFQWEFFAENNKASINDIINTSVGGPPVGEALYRLSGMILDTCATGRRRVVREVVAGLLDPGRGLNRVIHGDAWRVSPKPDAWTPSHFALFGQGGLLVQREGRPEEEAYKAHALLRLGLRYGDPFLDDMRKPFDSFQLRASFIPGQGGLLNQAELQGLLASTSLARHPRWQLLLAAHQFYDYTNIQAYKVGAQSFTGSLLWRHAVKGEVDVRTAVHVRGVVLAAISTSPTDGNVRGYDYGPGAGFILRAALGPWSRDYVNAELETTWIHTVSGDPHDHVVHAGRVEVDVPIFHGLGLGGSAQLFRRDSLIPRAKNETQSTPQFRVFVSWH